MASTTIEQALDVKLRANTTWLATLTGGLHAYGAPDPATLPYGFYSVISDPTDEEAFDNTDSGTFRIQFDFITATKAGKSIALAARRILNHLSGSLDGIAVTWTRAEAPRDVRLTTSGYQWQFDVQGEYTRA